MLLIGSAALWSAALQKHAPELLTREPGDWDFIATTEEIGRWMKNYIVLAGDSKVHAGFTKAGSHFIAYQVTPAGKRESIVEFEVAWPGSTASELDTLVKTDSESHILLCDPDPIYVPSLNVLFALKSSHRYLRNSPHFEKTRKDYMTLRAAGCAISPRYLDWYKAREKETYSYGHPNLSQTKMGFFSGDGVKYVYDHDDIHRVVALGAAPAYSLYLKDGAQVQVDRDKWDKLDEATKLASVLEESYVLALERSQIPHPGKWTPEKSFRTALMKVCSSITSGWWREYAYERYDDAIAAYDDTYVSRFWRAVQDGAVKAYGEASNGPSLV